MAALRALLDAGGSSPPLPQTATIGHGRARSDNPLYRSCSVVGGLSGLTLCLAGALVFAVARIYGWRFVRLLGRRSSTAAGAKKQSDVQDALEAGRAGTTLRLPSIVTSRLAQDSSEGTDDADSGRSTVSLSPTRTATTPLRTDASWKDCLIDADKIQILRRRDGKPWVLGGGAYGQVYKALYDGVQVVAAKVLTGLGDERLFQSFMREAAILRDMRDRNIVQFVIQEFMEAGSLFQALKWRDQEGRRVFGLVRGQGQPAPCGTRYARGKRAACDIARGLHYLHSHKIVHLDIKSSNILLARDGACKIADVGLARSLLTKTLLSEAGTMGTFAWSAPEVLTGQPCGIGRRLYSFGITLWEIVTGEIPNRGTMRNPEVPAERVLELIDKCTLADPRQRPTAKQIVQLLEKSGEGTPQQAQARGAVLRHCQPGGLARQAAPAGKPPPAMPCPGFPAALWVSFLVPGSSDEEEDHGGNGVHLLTNDAEELEEAAERAATQGPPPAPPQATLRLEDLPPLSEEDTLFK
ncbi:hypothetical protein ABPG77_001197 [Micractinium sp. CCAP 211/92]